MNAENKNVVGTRIDLLIEQADANHCDLVAKQGNHKGYLYVGNGMFKPNSENRPNVPDAALRASARREYKEVTYTCVPPGSGVRIAIDRDENGILDRDEI